MSTEFQIDGIAQIHISIDDISRAVAFYRDTLGLKLLFEVPAQSMAFFDCGGVRLYLGKAEKPEHRSQSFLYYRVPSMHAAFETLQGRGVQFTGAPHVIHKTETYELWLAAFRDPDGNYLHLMTEVPVATPA